MATEWYQGPAQRAYWWTLFLVVVVLGVLALMTLFLVAATRAYDTPVSTRVSDDDRRETPLAS